MKKIILTSALCLVSFASQASAYGYRCKTDTGKEINVAYSYINNYSLDKVIIDGQNFTQSSTMSNTRGSGLQIQVRSFRNGENLQLTIFGGNSSYQLGNGSQRSMSCDNSMPAAAKNDGI
jgi:hypothetical protein